MNETELAARHWAAFGVFNLQDWMNLLPDARGKMIDYLLGLVTGMGLWAILHTQHQPSLPLALAVGGACMWLAPQVSAAFYVWRLFGAVNWEVALDNLVRAIPMLGAGALVTFAMWRVAYQSAIEGRGS